MLEQVGVLEDLLVMVRPGWPPPQCQGGVHRWEFTAPSLFCVECGGEVPFSEYGAVQRWWQYLDQRPTTWN